MHMAVVNRRDGRERHNLFCGVIRHFRQIKSQKIRCITRNEIAGVSIGF